MDVGTTRRINVTLDEEHAQRLAFLAERANLQEGTMARSLLSRAIDSVDLDPDSISSILDRVDGAFDRVQAASRQIRNGESIPLDDL